ncbi:MAG: cytochrome-c peroxidase [Nitrospirae bacterium]|nr:cytochrome-c peroxidase [Nitrospirota bacterium]
MTKAPLTVGVFVSGITISQAQMELQLDLPLGLEKESLVIPEDNPLTREKVELGKLLFFDKRLSANNTIACASCHIPALAFTDGQPVSTGIHRQQGGGGHQRPLTGPSAQLNFGTAAQPRWKNSR